MQVANILRIVEKLEIRFHDDRDSMECLSDILQDKSMQALLKLHESVKPAASSKEASFCTNSVELVKEVSQASEEHSHGDMPAELKELSSILSSSHVLALLHCHDQVANKEFEPELQEPDPSELMNRDDDESVKVVRLMKGNEPLGVTIATDDDSTNNIIIARIFKGGAADRSGLIHVNDILVEVNKVSTRGKKPEEIIDMLGSFHGPLTFCLIPGEPLENEGKNDEPMYVRAKIDYNPEEDSLIPCAEAGLRFRKNDVLHIVSRDDFSWWQAELVDVGLSAQRNWKCTDTRTHASSNKTSKRAGLIPSAKLQNRRETLRLERFQTESDKDIKGSSSSLSSKTPKRNAWTLLRQSFRYSKRHHGSSPSLSRANTDISSQTDCPTSTVVAYEEVVLHPSPKSLPEEKCFFRPFVLVGPQGVGRNLLKDRLIDLNPTLYGVPVPHTSRPKLEEEEDGKDYHFVTRRFMEDGIRETMFLEYGEYKNNLYGTSIDAVKSVIHNHQVCVLTPYPQALKLLWNGDLKPFVVFVKPPDMNVVVDKQGSPVNSKKLTIERDTGQPFSAEELEDLVVRGKKLETTFGHMFNYTIVCDNVNRAFSELEEVAFAVENEPQWIVKEWEK